MVYRHLNINSAGEPLSRQILGSKKLEYLNQCR